MEQNGTTWAKPLLVGFSGKIGSGKSTICEMLERLLSTRLGLSVKTISFGMVLKRKVAQTFNFPLDWCYSTEGKAQHIKFSQPHYVLEEEVHTFKEDVTFKKQTVIMPHSRGMNVRNLLQWWGTEVCRRHDPHYWVKEWKQEVLRAYLADVILIDDVRFPNELYAVSGNSQFFGCVFRILPYDGWEFHSAHESETALDSYDFGEQWTLAPEKGHNFLQQIAWDIFEQIQSNQLQIRIQEMKDREGEYGFERW